MIYCLVLVGVKNVLHMLIWVLFRFTCENKFKNKQANKKQKQIGAQGTVSELGQCINKLNLFK